MTNIRRCRANDRAAILSIINAAAEAYRGVIPADRWHEPYMHQDELNSEIAAGVTFWGHEDDGVLVGVMGMQSMREVDFIRHAYVLPSNQGRGIGNGLLRYLRQSSTRRMLVGTWDAAEWRSVSIGATASNWSRRPARQCFSRPIGACRIDRSTLRWCSPIRRTTARHEFARGKRETRE